MSAAGESKPSTTKLVSNKSDAVQAPQQQKPAAQLEEDDEFEDFPVEDWAKEEEVGAQATNKHLWEESWDDDDTTDDFSVQLKAEIEKMGSQKKS